MSTNALRIQTERRVAELKLEIEALTRKLDHLLTEQINLEAAITYLRNADKNKEGGKQS